MNIQTANTKETIQRCFQAFKELRPHLTEDAFVAQVLRQMENHHYQMVYIEEESIVIAASGYRVAEYLAWGKTFYVDDIITISSHRHLGCAPCLCNGS